MNDTPGETTSQAGSTTQPMTRSGPIAPHWRPPGSTDCRRRPSNAPPALWKYHQGMPFIAVSTAVSDPSKGANAGALS